MFPFGGYAAHAAFAAVGDNDQRVGPKQVRDRVLVIAEVVVIGRLQAAMHGLEFDQYQRQAVDKADQIRSTGVHFAGEAELRAEEKVVVGRFVPVNHAHYFHSFAIVFRVGDSRADAVFEQVVEFAVGGHEAHAIAVAGEFGDSLVYGLGRHMRVEPLEGRA